MTGKVRKQPPVANSVANTVDSTFRAHFRSSFQTEVKRKQIQGRGIHNYRQMNDPVMQLDLQSYLQKPPLNVQVDLQKDLQADLQVSMDLQPDLQVRTGIRGTQHSSLVSFQAENSTEERSTSMGGTYKQGPIHVTGENLHPTLIYNKDLHPTWIYNRDLHPQRIYNKPHQLTGHTPPPTTSNALTPRASSHFQWQSGYTTTSVTHPSGSVYQ